MGQAKTQRDFGVILISLLLGLNVFSTMLVAELPGGNLVNYGATGLFLLAVIVVGMFSRKAVWFGAEWLLLMVWLCYAMIPSVLAFDVEAGMFKVLTMLQLAVWALAIHQAIIWRHSAIAPLLIYGAAVSGAYLLSFVGIGGGAAAGADPAGRVASTLANANTFGAAAVMGLGLCLLAAAHKLPTQLKWVQAILTLLLVAAVFNSGSRTALVGMIAMLLGSTWAMRVWSARQFVRTLPMLTVVVVIAAGLYLTFKDVPEVAERLDSIFSLEDPNSAISRLWDFIGVLTAGSVQAEQGGESMSLRLALIEQGLNLLLESHLLGIGLDNFRALMGAYSHSNVIEVLVATGVVGILLYYGIYLALVVRCVGMLRRDWHHAVPRMALVTIATLSLMDIQHVSYDTKQGWLFLAILIAAVEVSRRELVSTQTESRSKPSVASKQDAAQTPAVTPGERLAGAAGLTGIGGLTATAPLSMQVGKNSTLAQAPDLKKS